MAKKPRENRVPIMMSDAELAAVDDWRFTYRIATRSEAIRRLCQIGLRSARAFPAIAKDFADVLDAAAEATEVPEDVLCQVEVDGEDQAKLDREIAHKLFDAVNVTYNRQIAAQDRLHHLLVEIAPLTNNPRMEAAIELANQYLHNEYPNEEVLESIGESRKAQLAIWRRRRAQKREATQDDEGNQ